jgi:hypothetical protein
MDVRKLAAEKKAKALADLKEAEEMELHAAQIEAMAAKHGWHIDIKPANAVAAEKPYRAALTRPIITNAVLPLKKKPPTKVADPNSTTSRSKSESVKVIKALGRPVPLGELNERIKKRGVVIGGKNPTQALSANLGHCPELVATKRGWWLKDQPLPPEDRSPVIGGKESDLLGGLN